MQMLLQVIDSTLPPGVALNIHHLSMWDWEQDHPSTNSPFVGLTLGLVKFLFSNFITQNSKKLS